MKRKAELSHHKDSLKTNIEQNWDKIDNLILETIKSYIKPPTYPVTIHNIQQFVLDKLGTSVNKRKIKAYLKDSLNYSYKKGSAGSITLKLNNNKIQKSVFSSRMFINIYNNKLIVNIDESSF